jgi:hypothetical protein
MSTPKCEGKNLVRRRCQSSAAYAFNGHSVKVSKLCLDFTFFILTMEHDEQKIVIALFCKTHKVKSSQLSFDGINERKNDRDVMQKLLIVKSNEN